MDFSGPGDCQLSYLECSKTRFFGGPVTMKFPRYFATMPIYGRVVTKLEGGGHGPQRIR
jgi:hypothetical protein